MLPDSPRLLVLHGRREAALASLAKLRLRSLDEARTDPLVQVRACSAYFKTLSDDIPKDRAYGNGSGGCHASKVHSNQPWWIHAGRGFGLGQALRPSIHRPDPRRDTRHVFPT